MKLRCLPYKSLLFHLSSPSRQRITVLITHFQSSTFSTTTSSGSGSGSGSSHSSSRRPHHDEESRSVKVSVWWDLENCDLPIGTNKVFKVAQSITGAIRNSGIKGPITISAFGDVLKLRRSNQDALSSTGVNLTHVPQGGKMSVERCLFTDLMFWVSQNPPPAHLFLISSDIEFASVLHRLRMSNYNVLLASKSSASGVLCSAASIMWDWDALINEDSIVAKHFNQPPDGPYNSWYGHYRTPLLDPFATTITTEQSSSLKIEEVSGPVSNSDSVNSKPFRIRPVPKEVVSKIREVLSLFPNGAPISELRSELNKSNLAIDKEFYGYKTFSRLLQSMPEIFHVKSYSSFIVRALPDRTSPTRLDSSPGLSTAVDQKIEEKETGNASSPKPISNVELAAERRGRDDSIGKKQENITENDKLVPEEAPVSSQESILVNQKDVKANDKPVETNQVSPVTGSDSSMEDGFFQKLKRLYSGSLQMESEHLQENKSASASGDEDKEVVNECKPEEKDLKSSSQGTDLMSQISPSFVGESAAEEVKTGAGEVGDNDKDASSGFFSQLLKTFKFWGRNIGLSNDLSGDQKLDDVDSQVHDILAKESSWSDLESFINSPRGFVIVSHSRTREMMAKNLQREGPTCLKQLDEASMLHLVTLLISEKKWIEENPSSSLPFSIIKGSSASHSNASNGLSSIFSEFSKQQKQDSEKRFKNVAHAGVSVGYKSKAMADCQKLIKKIIEKNPEGYSLFRFRKDFLEEYGYFLAVEKLGYESLLSLIQVMPGVKVSSGYIMPLTSSSDAKSVKKDESDLSFEELGPVSDATTTTNQQTTKKLPVYEPSLSEDEDSDSEGENLKKKKKKKVMNGEEEQSSLLQILDSYYPSKDGVANKEKAEERKLVNNTRKQKPSKTYSFVKDSEV